MKRIWLKWFPWRYLIRRLAHAYGFLDPAAVVSRLHRFAQPSEIQQPLELLRAGLLFHARGLINTQAIQHNLDWLWPFWVERQFDPNDEAFLPRAFSLTHINLTHRNWTAVGIPGMREYPIIDPAGLLTPYWDSWSLDVWIISDDDTEVIPSRSAKLLQRLKLHDGLAVCTEATHGNATILTEASVHKHEDGKELTLSICATARAGGMLVVSVRPYNPEGVSFIYEIQVEEDGRVWRIDRNRNFRLSETPDRYCLSNYRQSDVYAQLHLREESSQETSIECNVGLATGAAIFKLRPEESRTIQVQLLLETEQPSSKLSTGNTAVDNWETELEKVCQINVPDSLYTFLFDAAVRTLILLSPDEVYPGPYTYRRFWYRDAAFILKALLAVGATERVERALMLFPNRQTKTGYFQSQEGEWDSNGQVLWIFEEFLASTGRTLPVEWQTHLKKGAQWILKKRDWQSSGTLHHGLLPAGFSAEHFGPSDYYYWDDFWAIAGLQACARMFDKIGDMEFAETCRAEATDLGRAVNESVEQLEVYRLYGSIPASPYRRMDSGAIGSLAASYPLRLWPENDSRTLSTTRFLMKHCFFEDAFFQDMIHSGINPYLTLHIAQVLLRAGNNHFIELVDAVARLATPTGQWPEAVHPRTKGGCMGDGQHGWAAAEWILMLQNMFVREEDNRLILLSGIPKRWLVHGTVLSFGPTMTRFGRLKLSATIEHNVLSLKWSANWNNTPPHIEISLPGTESRIVNNSESEVSISL